MLTVAIRLASENVPSAQLPAALGVIEQAVEERLPGLMEVARQQGVTDLRSVREKGMRGYILGERAPKMLYKITERFGLAKRSQGPDMAGTLIVVWEDFRSEPASTPSERRVWNLAISWGDQSVESESMNFFVIRFVIECDVEQLVVSPGFRDDVIHLLVESCRAVQPRYGYAAVTSFHDAEPLEVLNNYIGLEPGVFAYSWMTVVPPKLADRLGAVPEGSEIRVVALEGASRGGVIVVAPTPPAFADIDRIRELRTFLEPVLLGPRENHSRALILGREPVPPGVLAEDWQPIEP